MKKGALNAALMLCVSTMALADSASKGASNSSGAGGGQIVNAANFNLMMQELQRLRDEVTRLNSKVVELESRSSNSSAASNSKPKGRAVDTSQFVKKSELKNIRKIIRKEIEREQGVANKDLPKGYWRIPNTDTIFTVGGYVKLDAIYDGGVASGDASNLPGLALTNQDGVTTLDRRGHSFKMHTRQSRIWFRSVTDTAKGPVVGYIETDFFGSRNVGDASITGSTTLSAWNLRLRHAYVTYGGWLAGQTWTNFADMSALGTNVEFNGAPGVPLNRYAQLRYTFVLNDNPNKKQTLSIAVEHPTTDYVEANTAPTLVKRDSGSVFGGGSASSDTYGSANLPDLTAQYKIKSDKGHFTIRGLVRKLIAKFPDSTDYVGCRKHVYGWGLGISGKLFIVGKSFAFAQLNFGKGMARHIFDGRGFSAALNTTNGQFRGIKTVGWQFGYVHYWTDNLLSNFSYGRFIINRPSIMNVQTVMDKRMEQLFVNLIYTTKYGVDVGIEYGWWRRTANYKSGVQNVDNPFSKLHGVAKRVQAMVKYKFNHK